MTCKICGEETETHLGVCKSCNTLIATASLAGGEELVLRSKTGFKSRRIVTSALARESDLVPQHGSTMIGSSRAVIKPIAVSSLFLSFIKNVACSNKIFSCLDARSMASLIAANTELRATILHNLSVSPRSFRLSKRQLPPFTSDLEKMGGAKQGLWELNLILTKKINQPSHAPETHLSTSSGSAPVKLVQVTTLKDWLYFARHGCLEVRDKCINILPCDIRFSSYLSLPPTKITCKKTANSARVLFPENQFTREGLDLSYLNIANYINLLFLDKGILSRQIADNILQIVCGGTAKSMGPDQLQFLLALITLIFGVEASRIDTVFLHAIMLLDLISIGQLSIKDAFDSGYFWDMQFRSEEGGYVRYGGIFPGATHHTGPGNIRARKVITSTKDTTEAQYWNANIQNMPKRHAVLNRELIIYTTWLNTVFPPGSSCFEARMVDLRTDIVADRINNLLLGYIPFSSFIRSARERMFKNVITEITRISCSSVQSMKFNEVTIFHHTHGRYFHFSDVCDLLPAGFKENVAKGLFHETRSIFAGKTANINRVLGVEMVSLPRPKLERIKLAGTGRYITFHDIAVFSRAHRKIPCPHCICDVYFTDVTATPKGKSPPPPSRFSLPPLPSVSGFAQEAYSASMGMPYHHAMDRGYRQSELLSAQTDGLTEFYHIGHATGDHNACLIASLLFHAKKRNEPSA